MIAALDTNPTQLTGLVAFALAAIGCAHAARRRPWPWRGLMAAQLACFGEIVIGLRLRVHDVVDAVLQAQGLYASRVALQFGLVAVALALAIACILAALRWRGADADAARALAATAGAVSLFVVESISLHGIDAIMYASVGPVLMIALLWATAAMIVTASALRSARR
jgi:hypothetical protein